ncbi:hypothetical protein NA647_01790 [Pseudomonas stutzeri]|uniref:hypothetical protein n=1 Tax=Stutzerimonas stutzeri TaxID=316 RepID=UPI0021097340|nr:hypothetical protein [Stutzerimonas stutzeri]MCQ4286169.1 hypothetical protein [Stutzerimonas stutzeri]
MILQPLDPHRLLSIANLSMAIGLVLLLFGVAGAYVFDRHLALGAVVGCHALVILGPTAFKIGYVMRLLAQRQLTLAV